MTGCAAPRHDGQDEPAPFRVLVTGSRIWADDPLLSLYLGLAVQECAPGQPVVIVHGAAREGADKTADIWARNHGIPLERHPADWNRYGQRAGYMRNEEMVDAGADVALAFIAPCPLPGCRNRKPHGTHGAEHCARLAEKAGIPVRRFTS